MVTFQTVQKKCVLCTETEHIPDSTSEMCTVHKTEHLPDVTSEICTAHTNRTFQTEHQKCVLCKQTEHFPDGTHKAVFTDRKTIFKYETQLNICGSVHHA